MALSYLKTQLVALELEINEACKRASRNRDEITLIGVTKTYEADVMNASIAYGITDIGENKVQEITRKYDQVTKGVKWHLIGHLQTNKVKYIIDKVDLIHSVDSLKLAEEISSRAQKIGKVQEVLIQVNVADETQKFGVSPENVIELIEAIGNLKNIKVCGLMNIAPFVDDPETLREDFKVMKELFDRLNDIKIDNVEAKYLSMGMSGDFGVAIEEGANMIRVGTRIYGNRNY